MLSQTRAYRLAWELYVMRQKLSFISYNENKKMDDEWWEEIIFAKREPEMELPEDILIYMMRKNPLLEELISKYDLDLEA